MDQVAKAPLTMALSSFTFAEGTNAGINTTGTNAYIIEGFFYSRTAITNQAFAATDYATGAAFIPMPVPGTTTGLPPGVPTAPTLGAPDGSLLITTNGVVFTRTNAAWVNLK